jgi:hypothetical protein
MEEETKKEPVKPEDEGLFEKTKKFIDKANDYIDEKSEDLKKSKTLESVANAIDKAEDYVEDKIEDIKKVNVKAELENFQEKTDSKANEKIAKAKKFGKKVAGKVADKLENFAKDIKNRTKDEEKPSDAGK